MCIRLSEALQRKQEEGKMLGYTDTHTQIAMLEDFYKLNFLQFEVLDVKVSVYSMALSGR